MQQLGSKNIMTPADPRSQKVKIQLFQNMVMLHNKLKENHASIYSLLKNTLNLWVGLKGKTNSECCHVAYQIKGKKVCRLT